MTFRHRAVSALLWLWAASLAVILGLVIREGWGYWGIQGPIREEHPAHAMFASGSVGGLVLGITGISMMCAMLLYTVRKKLVRVRFLGPVRLWLQFHVICGVFGPLFILVHAGFRLPTGLIAIGFWCMVAVALSGVFGRYVYGFLPRVANGRALAWDDAMTQLADMRADLVAATAGSDGQAVGQAVELVRDFDFPAHNLLDLFRLSAEMRRRKREIRALLQGADLSSEAYSAAMHALTEQLRLRRSLEASRAAYRLFRYWHLFHRPLASAMYVIVTVHILFALTFGGSLVRLAELFS